MVRLIKNQKWEKAMTTNGRGRGGRRAGAGRKKGRKNSPTPPMQKVSYALMAELARTFTVPALNKLAHLMYHAKSEAIQMHAANLLLDRAWGKAPQALQIRTQPEAERKRYTVEEVRQELIRRGYGAVLGLTPSPLLEAQSIEQRNGRDDGTSGEG